MKALKQNKGLLVIISAPSGGGKDSVIRGLLEKIPNSIRFVNTTSRGIRPGETTGIDYNYVSKEEFEKMIEDDELIEYNEYDGNYYGTEKKKLEEWLKKYDVVFFQIDVHGKANFDKSGWKNLSIFLLPESLDVVKQRIIARGGLTQENVEKRLKTAEKEMQKADQYDYKIVNYQGKLDETVEQAEKIIKNRLSDNIDKKPKIS